MSSKKKGSLEVICGPMFSGKSEELIRRLRRATIAQQGVVVFKPSIDNRLSTEHIVSHNGSRISAFAIHDTSEIIEYGMRDDVHVIGFDETQFFDNSIVPVICTLVEAGKRVIVGGLDLDFRGAPFGSMPLLMAIANQVTKLQAICTICGNDANFTQRLVDGQAARHDDPIILVGAQEAYQARCRQCYVIDKYPSFHQATIL